MASSFSTITSLVAALGGSPSEKLARENYLFWKAQVLPALCGAQVMWLLDDSAFPPMKTMEVEDAKKKKKTMPTLSMESASHEINKYGLLAEIGDVEYPWSGHWP